jgi:hypothetical protein
MYREYFEALRKNNKKVAIVTGSSRGIGLKHLLHYQEMDGFYTYATMRNLYKSKPIIELAGREQLPL